MQASSPWSRLPKFRQGAFALFVTSVVLSAVLGDQPMAGQLVLEPGAIADGRGIWQPLTANFMYPEGDMFGLVGTLIVQWFVGGALEGYWGTRKYVSLVLGAGLAGYVVAAVLGIWVGAGEGVRLGGATAMDLAAVAAFGVVYGRQRLNLLGMLPLSTRGLAVLICSLSVVSPLVRGDPWLKVVPWLVAMLGAVLVTTQPWRRGSSSGKVGGRKRAQKRSHLKVVRPDDRLLN